MERKSENHPAEAKRCRAVAGMVALVLGVAEIAYFKIVNYKSALMTSLRLWRRWMDTRAKKAKLPEAAERAHFLVAQAGIKPGPQSQGYKLPESALLTHADRL